MLLKLSHQGSKVAPGILPSSSGSLFLFYSNLVDQMVTNLPAMWETRIDAWVEKIPWRRQWQPIPGSLPEEFHGERRLTGYSPWGCKESDTTEWLYFQWKEKSVWTLNMHYTSATLKTAFQENKKYVYLDRRIYTALMRAGFRFPTEPQMIIPLLKTGETGYRCLWGVRKR